MEQAALLAELRALADHTPDFRYFTPTSRAHQEWLGKVDALVHLWSPSEGITVRTQIAFIGYTVARDSAVAIIVGVLYRTIADLELRLSAGAGQAFGPGAVYDFFKALRELLASAKQSILIVDPYLDEEVFDAYISALGPHVAVRLLARVKAAGLKTAIGKFIAQTTKRVEARVSEAIHDRVIFLDDRSCWVLGQSIKDAAKAKPTYLAPLDTSTADLKRAEYQKIWNSATLI